MKENLRLVQIANAASERRVALVQEPNLLLLEKYTSIYHLALAAIQAKETIQKLIQESLSEKQLNYDGVYNGQTEWRLLPSFDCFDNPFACTVSGTGLTHKNSALNRQMMHAQEEGTVTDSMKMYQWGIEGGQPEEGNIGVQPEWFYKGTGAVLKGHGDALPVPPYANDGGEEPEVAGVYVVDKEGTPHRIGFTTANEFSDHVMERKNYLYLAPSKLRSCAIGPELVLDADFANIEGTVKVLRDDEELWSASIRTGARNMAHSLANLEYHHFKYADHRQPFQAHVHFFGADAFSFGAGIQLTDGDEMQVHWQGLGRPLINKVNVEAGEEETIRITPLVKTSTELFVP
ncbi:MAG TPA: AraD1 family protein [Flavisolibacter sp.]